MARKPVSLEAALSPKSPSSKARAAAQAEPVGATAAMTKLTVYVPPKAAKRLRLMALEHEKRVNDFLQEGLNLMLKKYGQKSLAEFAEED